MANRVTNQFVRSLERQIVKLFGNVAIGATGAPTLSVSLSKGIASIARTGAGAYTITLQDQYLALAQFSVSIQLASGAPAAPIVVVRTVNLLAAAPVITIQFLNTSGVATDPDNGTTLYMQINVDNSSA